MEAVTAMPRPRPRPPGCCLLRPQLLFKTLSSSQRPSTSAQALESPWHSETPRFYTQPSSRHELTSPPYAVAWVVRDDVGSRPHAVAATLPELSLRSPVAPSRYDCVRAQAADGKSLRTRVVIGSGMGFRTGTKRSDRGSSRDPMPERKAIHRRMNATCRFKAVPVWMVQIRRLLMLTLMACGTWLTQPAHASYIHLNMLEGEILPPASGATSPILLDVDASGHRTGNNMAAPTPFGLTGLQAEGARPSPSDRLPIEDLLENPDQSLDPSPKDLNPKVLRKRLGRQFDEAFFSIDEPADMNKTSLKIRMKNGRPADEARPDFLKYLRTFRLPDGRWMALKSGKKQRRRVQKFIWSFTSCPVQFNWKDLGLRFWPRWLKQGGCWNGKPCSFPPGMSCQPSRNVTKTLLRWHCRLAPEDRPHPQGEEPGDDQALDVQDSRMERQRNGRHIRRRKQCRWIPVQYPIISQCSCRC